LLKTAVQGINQLVRVEVKASPPPGGPQKAKPAPRATKSLATPLDSNSQCVKSSTEE